MLFLMFFFSGLGFGYSLAGIEAFRLGRNSIVRFRAPQDTVDKMQEMANWGKTRKLHDLFICAFAIFEKVWQCHRDGGTVILRDRTGNDVVLSLDKIPF